MTSVPTAKSPPPGSSPPKPCEFSPENTPPESRDDGNCSRLQSFSIWQYPISRPALWPSQMIDWDRPSRQTLGCETERRVPAPAVGAGDTDALFVRNRVASRPMPQPLLRNSGCAVVGAGRGIDEHDIERFELCDRCGRVRASRRRPCRHSRPACCGSRVSRHQRSTIPAAPHRW